MVVALREQTPGRSLTGDTGEFSMLLTEALRAVKLLVGFK
jgi:hypothetical protein